MKFRKYNADKSEVTFSITMEELFDLTCICEAVAETTYLQDIAALGLTQEEVKKTLLNLQKIHDDAIEDLKTNPQPYGMEGTPDIFRKAGKEVEWGPGGRFGLRKIALKEEGLVGKIDNYAFRIPYEFIRNNDDELIYDFKIWHIKFEEPEDPTAKQNLTPIRKCFYEHEIRRRIRPLFEGRTDCRLEGDEEAKKAAQRDYAPEKKITVRKLGATGHKLILFADGKDIEVPCESLLGEDIEKATDFFVCPAAATDAKTGEVIDAVTQKAISIFLEKLSKPLAETYIIGAGKPQFYSKQNDESKKGNTMEYGTKPIGKQPLGTGRMNMEVKMLAPMKEHTIFSVDNRRIEVPHEYVIGKDKENFTDSRSVFYPIMAVDAVSREPIDEASQQAIADYIKKLAKEEGGGDMKVVMTIGGKPE